MKYPMAPVIEHLKLIEKEKLFMVMDDTANSGKEPYKCQSEQEQKAFDDMVEKYKKEFGL